MKSGHTSQPVRTEAETEDMGAGGQNYSPNEERQQPKTVGGIKGELRGDVNRMGGVLHKWGADNAAFWASKIVHFGSRGKVRTWLLQWRGKQAEWRLTELATVQSLRIVTEGRFAAAFGR